MGANASLVVGSMDGFQSMDCQKDERSGVSKKREWPATVAARGCNSRARRKKREGGWTKVARGEGGEGEGTGAAAAVGGCDLITAVSLSGRQGGGSVGLLREKRGGAWRTIGKQRGPPGSTADQSSIVVVKNSVGSLCIFHFRGRRISRHLCHQTCLVLGGKSLYNRQHRSRRCPKPRASDCRALRRQQPRLFLLPLLSQSADGHIHLPLPLLSRRRTKNMFHFHARQTGSVLSTLPRDRSFPMQVAENSGVFGKTLRVRSSVVLAMAMTALNMEDGRRLAGTGLGPASSGERRTLMQERWKQSGQIGTEPQIRRPLFSSRACQALAHRLGFSVEIDCKFQCRPTQTNTT